MRSALTAVAIRAPNRIKHFSFNIVFLIMGLSPATA
jgi:hypothetical protein